MKFEKGEQITVFRNETVLENKEKSVSFNTSISKKGEDGNYVRMSVRVRFTKDLKENALRSMELDTAYKLSLNDAFLSFDEWNDKDGVRHTVPVIVISECDVVESKKIEKKDSSKKNPFDKKGK